jgi:predicted  nucleic acid-binding Zn-ribbon protein
MKDKSRFDVAGTLLRVCLALAVAAMALTPVGCGRQEARLEENQIRMQAMIEAGNQQMATIAEQIAANQLKMQNGIRGVQGSTQQISAEVTAVRTDQAGLQQTLQEHRTDLTNAVVTAEQNQNDLRAAITDLNAENAKLAADIAAVGIDQAEFRRTARDNDERLLAGVTLMGENQQDLQARIESVHATARKLADDVATAANEQVRLQKLVADSRLELTGKIAGLEQNQQNFQTGIEDLTANTNKAAAEIASLAGGQAELTRIVRSSTVTMADRMVGIEKNQQDLQAGIEGLQTTSQKMADEIIAVANAQVTLQELLASTRLDLSDKIAGFQQTQQKLQANVEKVHSATQKAADDIAAFANGQVKLEELITGGSLQITEKVALVEQNQQQWHGRMEDVQSNLQQLAAVVASLEQNLAKLQQILQSNTQELATIKDEDTQQRLQLEQTIKEEIRSIADSISAIRQNQASLAEQIEQMQTNAADVDDIVTAIEQFKTETDQPDTVEPIEIEQIRSVISETTE